MPPDTHSHSPPADLPRYQPDQTYEWNYSHAPDPVTLKVPELPGDWTYADLPVASPLAIAAGPLLNGRWLLYYASLGFDILTYKTVRSRHRPSYPLPNLQPVDAPRLTGNDTDLPAADTPSGSWAVSFGMPSREPDIWRADVESIRRQLPPGKLLSVSVVATPDSNWTTEQLAADFAQCARWAVESGADCVEANFSCPNVASADGQLHQQPESAGLVARIIRDTIGATPFLIKLGHVPEPDLAGRLIDALAPHADALVMVNCIPARVRANDGTVLFNGESRGIAGDAIRPACLEQIRCFTGLIRERKLKLRVIGVGGISAAEHVNQFLAAGCEAVQLATAAMLDPGIALRLRAERGQFL
jgi:dihydroorotate dehydrogenase